MYIIIYLTILFKYVLIKTKTPNMHNDMIKIKNTIRRERNSTQSVSAGCFHYTKFKTIYGSRNQ